MNDKIAQFRSLLSINGVIAIIFGLFAILVPQETAKTITLYFGLMLIGAGALGIFLSVKTIREAGIVPYNMLGSVLSVIIGIFIVIYTKRSLEIFAIIVGIWAVLVGVMQLLIALRIDKRSVNRKIMIFNSIITLVFGLVLFFNPLESIALLTFLVGALALVFGGIMVYISLMIKRLNH